MASSYYQTLTGAVNGTSCDLIVLNQKMSDILMLTHIFIKQEHN